MESTVEKRILITGLVSAKVDVSEALVELERQLQSRGGQVVQVLLQRRGVSRSPRPGGAHQLHKPLSSAFFLGKGKVQEVAQSCMEHQIDLVVVLNELNPMQKKRLSELFGVPILTASQLESMKGFPLNWPTLS